MKKQNGRQWKIAMSFYEYAYVVCVCTYVCVCVIAIAPRRSFELFFFCISIKTTQEENM